MLKFGRGFVFALTGSVLVLGGSSVRAWELGFVTTWIKGEGNGGISISGPGGGTGLSYGASLMLKEDLCRYSDINLQVGYTKADCFKVGFVPIELAASAKLPLLEDRLVPYVGMGVGYHIFTTGTIGLEDSVGFWPLAGVGWRFGRDNRWCLFMEGRYRFLSADVTSGFPSGTRANLDGYGGSFGLSYRF
jgi:hypothetical protein